MEVSIPALPTLTMKNRSMVQQSTNAGCMNCCKIYPVSEIKSYTDYDKTCLCPHCGIDAVIGDMCGYPINTESVTKAHDYWYKKS